MKSAKPISPYLRRSLRSLQEVLQARRKRGGSAKTTYGLSPEGSSEAENNNAAPPNRKNADSA